jgi:hypothetical protein
MIHRRDCISGQEKMNNDFFAVPIESAETRALLESQRQGALTRSLLNGDSLFQALHKAVKDLSGVAPKEHDVLVEAFGISVRGVNFIPPHTFLLHGNDDQGNETYVIAHFSQLVARVVYLPKRGPERVITGFYRGNPEEGSV